MSGQVVSLCFSLSHLHLFILTVADPTPSSMAASVGKSCPPLQTQCGSLSRLMVTPRVSGLERSQEKSLEQHFPETVCPSTSSASFSRLPSPGAAAGPLTRPSPNGNSSRHNGNDTTLSKPKPFLTLPGRSHSIYNINNRYDRCLYFDHCIYHSHNLLFFGTEPKAGYRRAFFLRVFQPNTLPHTLIFSKFLLGSLNLQMIKSKAVIL